MSLGQQIFTFGCLVVAVIAGSMAHRLRAHARLKEWAEEQGFEIIYSEYRSYWAYARGPFARSNQRQAVFLIRVRKDWEERSGWILFGGSLVGLSSDRIEVKWEAPA